MDGYIHVWMTDGYTQCTNTIQIYIQHIHYVLVGTYNTCMHTHVKDTDMNCNTHRHTWVGFSVRGWLHPGHGVERFEPTAEALRFGAISAMKSASAACCSSFDNCSSCWSHTSDSSKDTVRIIERRSLSYLSILPEIHHVYLGMRVQIMHVHACMERWSMHVCMHAYTCAVCVYFHSFLIYICRHVYIYIHIYDISIYIYVYIYIHI